jgi:hypothetical protein
MPNNVGLNCNYIDSAIYLNGSTACGGLPNFIDSYDYSNTVYNCADTLDNISYAFIDNSFIDILPNPATNFLKLFTTSTKQSIISIHNLQGQLIKQQTTNSKTTNIGIYTLARGMYFVKVENEKGVAVMKFIKE